MSTVTVTVVVVVAVIVASELGTTESVRDAAMGLAALVSPYAAAPPSAPAEGSPPYPPELGRAGALSAIRGEAIDSLSADVTTASSLEGI